jgi:hypothetical protein
MVLDEGVVDEGVVGEQSPLPLFLHTAGDLVRGIIRPSTATGSGRVRGVQLTERVQRLLDSLLLLQQHRHDNGLKRPGA